ncbi:MAG: hypothetical protein J6Y92_00050 [Lentisphaeria bacterium]|nr:hypothetical protein [Lentisphaeria bacterium]
MNPEQNQPAEPAAKGYSFNTFSGVFLPSILTILGVVMFMRLGSVTGEVGILGVLGILFLAESIAFATGLSISAISTNTMVRGGGPYYLISRSLGPGFGSSIGLTYFVSQSLSVPFYITGFSDAFVTVFPSYAPALLWVGMIPLLILFIIAIIGANWAIRTQYAIMAILALSIVVIIASAIACGPSAEQFQANLHARKGLDLNVLTLATNFAIFFPAVTGFLAGANMSGDLEDARKSIPRGTILAISAGFVIYLVEILLFGATWPREKLLDKEYYETLKDSAIFGTWYLVFAGVAAATLSSALGTLIGAPRILQAFAADKIFKPLNIFAWGRGKNNDPIPAMCVTLAITIATLLWGSRQTGGNALNAVAELVTMFTLCTYGIINIAAAVEHFAANPSFRPKFRLFHWSVGCYGAVACFVVALFINAVLMLVAFSIVFILFLIAKRKSLASTFGDARRGYYFERIRRCLIHLTALPSDARNWRPQILILAGPRKKHLALIRYGSLLNNERGIMSVARFLNPGPDPAAAERQRKQEEARLREIAEESGTTFFPVAVTTSEETDFDGALNVFLQSHSLGPLAPNIVLSGWPVHEERVEAFFRHLQTIRLLRMNTLVLINPERAAEEPGDGPIDIWWRGRQNGSLMLILAHLLICNRGWHKTKIRLLRLADPENRLNAEQELARLAYDSRIEAQHLVLSQEASFESAFRAYSSHASLIFLGFIPPHPDDCRSFYDRISIQLEGMPTTFLAASAGDTDLDS